MRIRSLALALAIAGLTAGGAYAAQQSSSGKIGAYCLESSNGTKNCTFASLATCNAAKKGASDKCARNPQATTGSGASQSPGSSSSPMKKN